MSGLEDRLSLDVTDALNAIAKVDDAVAQIGTTLQQALDNAVASFNIPDTTVDLTANVDDVGPAIDEAVAGADTDIAVEADATAVTEGIDAAVNAADTQVEVDADTSAAQDALQELADSAPIIEPEVDTSGIDAAAASLDGVSQAGQGAGKSAEGAAVDIAALGAAGRVATGELGALEGAAGLLGGSAAGAVAGVGALAAGVTVLFHAGLESEAATQRFNLILGDFADTVDRVDVGGLNTDLKTLAVSLGDTDENLQNAAATMFGLGVNSGVAAPKVAETTKQVIALAARAVALNPALGEVGDVAERLFTGLARGGRFAANFNLALTSTEITARALADTGKATAAELTIFEKSAAGAELAVEKLGDGLSTDINAGAENVQLKLRAVKAAFQESLDALGEPLVDPLLDGITKAEPALEGLAQVFGALAQAVVPVVAALAEGLAPVLEAVAPVAQALADALKIVADALGLIPAPVVGAAAAILGLSAGIGKMNSLLALGPAGAGGRVAALAQRFPLLTSAIGPALAALATVGIVTEVFSARMRAGDESVRKFISGVEDTNTAINNVDELQKHIDLMREQVNNLAEDSKKAGGGPLGLFRQKGEVRDLQEGASALNDVANEQQILVNTARGLQQEFGLTSEAALKLARSGDEAIAAFRGTVQTFNDTTDATASYNRELDFLFEKARAGVATQEDLISVMNLTGQSADDVAQAFADAHKPVEDFANTLIDSLPGASEAIDKLSQDGPPKLQAFLDQLTGNTLEAAQFVGNLNSLIERGAGDLAETLAAQGAAAASGLAAQAAKLSDSALAAAEANIDRVNEIKGNISRDANTIATNTVGGGLDVALEEANRAFGEKLEKIPGQLGEKASNTGQEVGNAVVQGIKDGLTSEDLEAIFGTEVTDPMSRGLSAAQFRLADEGFTMGQKAGSAIVGGFNASLGIHSPSRVMQEIGELMVEGLAVGLADLEGAADAIDPVLDTLNKFKLTAADVSKASGDSIDEIVKSLTDLGEAQKAITPDELKQIGDVVKGLGGTKGVKELQTAIAQQTAAAFKGLSADEIKDVVSKLNTQAALTRVQSIIGVTPKVPTPFDTNVVKGADAAAPNPTIGELNVTVTPPPDATPDEMALLTARAVGWQLQGIRSA